MTVLSPTHAADNHPTEMEREPATAPALSFVSITDVPEYVVQDVRGRRLIVHCDIQECVYTSRQVLAETDTLTLASAPDNLVAVAALLPPVTLGQIA